MSQKIFFFSFSFHCEMFGWTYFGINLVVCFVNAVNFINTYFVNFLSITFYKFKRAPLLYFFSFVQINNLHAICDVWCILCDLLGLLFVICWFYESRGDQNHPICMILGFFLDIPKWTVICTVRHRKNKLHELCRVQFFSDFPPNLYIFPAKFGLLNIPIRKKTKFSSS